MECDSVGRAVKLQHITCTRHPQRSGENPDAPRDKQGSPTLLKPLIVCIFVHQFTVYCAKIVRPLVFHVNQRPLPPAEFEMLDARELEENLLRPVHPIRIHVTPSGNCCVSTVTV